MIGYLRSKGKKVYLLLAFPTSNEVDPLAVLDRRLTGSFSIKSYVFSKSDFLNLKGTMPFSQKELINRIETKALESGAEVVSPMDALQRNDEFPWHEGLKPCYRDGAHYTASFIRERASFLDKLISPENPPHH
jgi:hypothetical protein